MTTKEITRATIRLVKQLGHTNIRVTLDTYSHVLPVMQENLSRMLNSALKMDL